jgi:hypothetical protein
MSGANDVWNDSPSLDSVVREVACQWRDRGFLTFAKYADPYLGDMPTALRMDGVLTLLEWKGGGLNGDPAMTSDYDRIVDAASRAVALETEIVTSVVKDERRAAGDRGIRVVFNLGTGARTAAEKRPAQAEVRHITYDNDGVLVMNGVRSESLVPASNLRRSSR